MKEQDDKQDDSSGGTPTFHQLDKDGEVLMHSKNDRRAVATHLLLQLGRVGVVLKHILCLGRQEEKRG